MVNSAVNAKRFVNKKECKKEFIRKKNLAKVLFFIYRVLPVTQERFGQICVDPTCIRFINKYRIDIGLFKVGIVMTNLII